MTSNPTGSGPPTVDSTVDSTDSTVDSVVMRLRAAGCVFAEDEAALLLAATDDPDRREALIRRRIAGLPLEQLLGWVEFGGLRLQTDIGVFVPRQRTLLMAEQAVSLTRPGDLLLDLCCGVGAVAAVVADRVDDVDILAADLDPVATRCAEQNLRGQRARVFTGDLFDPLPASARGRVDVVTANVPYVPSDQIALMPPEAREHEPRTALDGGPDGLEVARRVITGAAAWLRPGGRLLIEISAAQSAPALTFARRQGLAAGTVFDPDRDTTLLIARSAPHDPQARYN